MTAFKEFEKDAATRMATPPARMPAEIIGSYRPPAPQGVDARKGAARA